MYYLPQGKLDFEHVEKGLKQYWTKTRQISKGEYDDLVDKLEFYKTIIEEAGCEECAKLFQLYKSSSVKQRDKKMTEVCCFSCPCLH